MKKKMLTGLFMFLIIFTMSSTSLASGNSKYQVNTPDKDSISTTKDTMLISGKAPRGTKVTIDLYGAVDVRGKNYTLANLPNNKDYVFISKQNLKSGAAGFGEEVKLIKGINKVIVTFKVDGVKPVQKIIYMYDKDQLLKSR